MATVTRVANDSVAMLPESVDPFALSLNENPFPPLPAVRSALIASVEAANRYPEFLPERLRAIIAGHIGVDHEQVIVGAGATGVAMQVLRAVTGPGDRIVLTTPTFDGYPIIAKMAGLAAVEVPLSKHGRHDLDAMSDAAAQARVVVLCRPHNPTGTIESAGDLERFLCRIPIDTVVILDEAYAEFVADADRIDTAALVGRHPNVVVLRTFSKAYGLAGLRIGYGFCGSELGRLLWAMQLPFGVGICSLVAVSASYAAEDQLRQRVALITAERRYLQMRLRSAGIYSTDAHANFLYLPASGRPWREVFSDTALQLRHYDDGAVRITVGTRPSTKPIIAAIESSGGHP